MTIIKAKPFILRPLKRGDEFSLAKNINNKTIYRNTLHIPYPYTLKDAKKWIKENLKLAKKKNPTKINFAIDIDGEVAGPISLSKIKDHQAEIGYWLAEKYRGQGITSEAIKLVTKFGFKKLGLRRIYACVFIFNRASKRVLEKNGYQLEGLLRKHVRKGKKILDDYLLARVV